MWGQEFHGTDRFVVEGRLGAGGMGVVYRARDLQRGDIVALKTMARIEADSLLQFKNEFRSLADISHPNVVQLYELFSDGQRWFFTMELVNGVDLLSWVKSSLSLPPPPPAMATSDTANGLDSTILANAAHLPGDDGANALERGLLGVRHELPPNIRRPFAVRDVTRLRDALRQLAGGLNAIHAAGKLHRDIKPSNVLVTLDGRVVLLDFGVAADLVNRRAQAGIDMMAGTPAYMAPEQAAFKRATPASDWYAVGVVLYEALAGRLPFDGPPHEIIRRKQELSPLPPSAFVDGVPTDLEEVAMALLERDPDARPTSDRILARLECEAPSSLPHRTEPPFVGRGPELDRLRAAARRRGLVIARLRGRSGMGKSALAARFLGELAGEDIVLFSGRCYEREAVPFRAIDPVIDELRGWLAGLSRFERRALLPPDIGVLAQIFPVLGDVSGPPSGFDRIDPHELRRRAFEAMRALFSAIATRHRVVVFVDDLQWCDADSVELLDALFAPPSPPWMFLYACRSELADSSPALLQLESTIGRLGEECTFEAIEVGELDANEADELAQALLRSSDDGTQRSGATSEMTELLTSEARGSPLFLAELARWANDRLGSTHDAGELSLERVILERVARLPDAVRALLETLCVARGPLAHVVATRAAHGESQSREPALALRAARLVVTRGFEEDDPIEPAHDRIREIVASGMQEERRRACHSRIARALADRDVFDPEAVFEHYRAAAEPERAREWVLGAAEAANQSLAFLRAAALYRDAITLDVGEFSVLHRKLGDALANGGRLAEAADAYLAAASRTAKAEAIELRRLAAEGYLKSGQDARGLAVLREVLSDVDLAYPRSPGTAIASLLWNEAKLRTRPLRLREHAPSTARAADLARIDVAFAGATFLSLSDPVRGAHFASQGLLLALEAREPIRLSRFLVVTATNTAARGEPARARAQTLVRAAERIAEDVDDPHTHAFALLGAGTVHLLLGEWRASRTKLERAERILREKCRGVAWELANARCWTCNVLILMGELGDAVTRAEPLLEEAASRKDRFARMHLVYPTCISRIVDDDVDGARRVLSMAADADDVTAGWWGALISACSLDRYCGDGRSAFKHAASKSPALEASTLWRSAIVRVFWSYEHGLSALAGAESGADRDAALRLVDRLADELAKEKLSYAPALGHSLRAGAAALRGHRGSVLDALDAAIPTLEAAELGYLAACARYRKGELVGGTSGADLVRESRAFLSTQGVVDHERCLAMSAPGFTRVRS